MKRPALAVRGAVVLRAFALLLLAGLAPPAAAQVTTTPLYDLVRSMPENSWAKANRNPYSEVWAPAALRPLYNSAGSNPAPDKIIRSWSGFAWDTTRGDLILWGGGHANYAGNEVYRWRSSTLRWERASLPSDKRYLTASIFNAIDGPDAAPVSAHTYDNNTYLPVLDRFVAFGGAAYQNGGAWFRWTDATKTELRRTGPYLWDPNLADPMKVGGTTGSHPQHDGPHPEVLGGNMWVNRELYLDFPNAPIEHVNGCVQTTVENGRDVVYIAGRRGGTSNVLSRWEVAADPDDDAFSRVGGYWEAAGGQTTCGYWPERKLFLYTSSGTNPLVFWDLTNPGPTNYNRQVALAGLQPLIDGLAAKSMSIENCALKFDPVRQHFLLWCGDATLWRIVPPPTNVKTGWSVQQVQGGGTAPVKVIGTGLLGKWKYAPGFDVFVGLMDPVDGSVWVYKPAGWVDPAAGGPLPNRAPTAAPTASPSPARVGASVTFRANASDSDGTIASAEWVFGDGQRMSGTTVARSFAAPGSYSAQVTVTDDDGATGSGSLVLTVAANAAPVVTASATPANAVTGQVVSFAATASDSDGSIASIQWTFGDGGSASGANASYAYAAIGTYTAGGTVTDNEGASASATVSVSVTPAPVPGEDVTLDLQQGRNGYAGTSDTWLDRYLPGTSRAGDTLLNVNPNDYAPLIRFAVFQAEGGPVPNGAQIVAAQLSLYKRSAYNQTYRLQRVLVPWIASQASWNQRQTGVPWAVPGALGAGTDVDATADAQASAGWDPAWVRFDVTARVQAWATQAATGVPANHGWRVDWNGGNTNRAWFDSAETGGTAPQRPTLSVTWRNGSGTANQPPSVAFTQPAANASLPLGEAVAIAASAADADGSIASVEFRVGSTVLATDATAPFGTTWTPSAAGTYTLTAIATDNAGATTTATRSVSVSAPANVPPTVSASATPTSAKVGSPIAFSATASDPDGGIASIDWTFGDGGTASGANVARAYAQPGSYTATVTVRDTAGAIATSSVNVTIVANLPPAVSATASPASAQTGQSIAFAATASDPDGGIASIAWTFGDGGSANGANVSHAYTAAGAYTARVTVTDTSGATAIADVPVSVTQAPPPGQQVVVALRQGQAGYTGATDTYLDRWLPGTSWQKDTLLNVDPGYFAPLLRFAVFAAEGGPVPDGAKIVSAELALYKRSAYNQSYRLQRLLVPWQPLQATWNQRLAGVAWSVPGAQGAGTDVDTAVDASASVGWDPASVRFDVTARLQAWSSQAQAGTLANHGWRVDWNGGNTNRAWFDSNETSIAGAQRPTLTVTYEQP